MNRKKYLIPGAILLVLITALITYMVSSIFILNKSSNNYSISFDPKSVAFQNLQKFTEVRDILKKDFYEQVDENVLLEGAVAGMAASLNDPYTVYYTKDQMQQLRDMADKSEENYTGIGVSIYLDNNGIVTVIEPFEGSPGAAAGILPGDKIMEIDGQDISALKDDTLAAQMIKGAEGTTVKLKILRSSENRMIDFEIVRKKIKLTVNIRSSVLDNGIGYIRILSFMDNNIAKIFNDTLSALLAKNITSLIIDVRDNPGGSLDQVENIADRLLPEGLIVYTENRDKKVVETRMSDKTSLDMPIVLLVNQNSASASEILAGALKDHQKAKLVGTKTFGKGLVQEILSLNDGSGVKVTIARYFTPSGAYIQGIGITPDYIVNLPDEYKNTPVSQIPKGKDNQLQKAIDLLKNK